MKALCVLIIALVWIPFASAAGSSDKSLIVYHSFDEEGDVAKDITGNGNDGQFVGVDVKWVEGKFKTAIELDGSNYVDIPWSDSIDVGDKSFSIEIWFKYEEAASNGVLVWGYDMGSGPHGQFWFRTEPGNFRIRGLIGDGAVTAGVRTVEAYNDNQWHHLGVVRDAGTQTLILYIDGENKSSERGNVGSITETQTFGIQLGRKVGNADMLKGSLDEFRFWGKALTENEIKANMNKGADSFLAVHPDDHLAATWGDMKTNH